MFPIKIGILAISFSYQPPVLLLVQPVLSLPVPF
jgi:hypothetical protein